RVTAAATESPGVVAVDLADEVVSVTVTDGREFALHMLALRDLCPCPDCRHAFSGQRLFESARVLPGIAARAATVSEGGALVLDWEDGHRSVFSATELAAATAPPPAAPEPLLWGAERGGALQWHTWESVSADKADFAAWLRDAASLGFSLLRGVPCE